MSPEPTEYPPSTPVWLTAGMKILKENGLSTVIALVLIWFMLIKIGPRVEALQATIDKNETAALVRQTSQDSVNARVLDALEQISVAATQTCITLGKTEEQRTACLHRQ